MILSKLKYLNRFSNVEIATILSASDLSPELRVYVFKLTSVEDVDTNDPETVAGLNLLEAAGLLGAGRANQIRVIGYVTINEPFNEAFPDQYEIREILPDGTCIIDSGVAFAQGNYEVVT